MFLAETSARCPENLSRSPVHHWFIHQKSSERNESTFDAWRPDILARSSSQGQEELRTPERHSELYWWGGELLRRCTLLLCVPERELQGSATPKQFRTNGFDHNEWPRQWANAAQTVLRSVPFSYNLPNFRGQGSPVSALKSSVIGARGHCDGEGFPSRP